MVGKRWLTGLAALCVLAAAVACSHDESRPAADAGSGSGASPPDAAVIRSYVEALAEGDIDRAMELRCRGARQDGESKEQFGLEVQRLKDALGRPELVRVAESEPPTGVGAWVEDTDDPEEPWRERLDAVELRYWLGFDGVEYDEPHLAVVVDEDGERRICGHATHVADELFEEIDDDIRDSGLPPVRELADLMPASAGEGYEQTEDATSTPTPDHLPGAIEAHTRAWQQVGVRGGARVSAYRFTSPEVALAWAGHRARTEAGDAVEQFDVPELPGSVGVRISASAWLLIQPTGEPPFLDQVIFVIGDVGVQVAVTHHRRGIDTTTAADLTRQVVDLTRPPS